MTVCAIFDCERPVSAKSMCKMHLERVRRRGTSFAPQSDLTGDERFWGSARIGLGCWDWAAGSTTDGYGVCYLRGKQEYAHRVSYSLNYGEIPEGLFVDHMCHNPKCIRPAHLRLATNAVNSENTKHEQRVDSTWGRGVGFDKRRSLWFVRCTVDGKTHHRSGFSSHAEATIAAKQLRSDLGVREWSEVVTSV